MARTLHTGLFPAPPEIVDDDILVITFQRQTAANIGVPNYPLTRLASAAVRANGLAIAPPAFARHTLKTVIAGEYPGTDSGSLAARFRSSLEIVLRTGINTDQLIMHGSSRVGRLGGIAAAYRHALRNAGYIDRAELLWEAAHSSPEQRRILVVGHNRARKEEVLFINSVAADGSTYFLPTDDHGIFTANLEWANFLIQNGWTLHPASGNENPSFGGSVARRFISAPPADPLIPAFAYPSIDAEARGVFAQIKSLLGSGSDAASIAVVVRDQEQYLRPLAVVADEYGLPIRSSHTIPIAATHLGGFIHLLIAAIESKFQFESTARFVKHPYGPGVSGESFASARRLHISGYEKWEELCPQIRAVNWPAAASFRQWIARLAEAFDTFDVRKRSGGDAREALAYRGLFDALYALEKLEGTRDVSFPSFASALRDVLSDEAVPLMPGNAGVEVLTPKEMVGRSYGQVFILGMAEGIYPQPAGEDPVVDFFERQKLSSAGVIFASAPEVARWEDLSFFFTLAAARSAIYISFPKLTDNGEALPSSYLKRLGISDPTIAPSADADSSIEEQRKSHLRHEVNTFDDVIEHARRQYLVEMDRESSAPYGEYDGVIGVPHHPSGRTWSASQLTTIGQCSFKWFAQRVLRLQPLEEMEYGLDPATRGLLYHKALEIAVTRAKDEPDIRAAVLNVLDDAFADAEIDESVGLPVLPNWDQERIAQLRELRKAVSAPGFIFEGARVLGIEQKFEEIWEGFPLIGYIDRVDDTPDGLIAIDYKTSGSVPKGAKDENGKLTVDVQIPLYANVALKKLYPQGNYGNSIYYSLTKGDVLRAIKPDDMGKLERLAEDIRSMLAVGAFAVDPDDGNQACTYCDFGGVCRKGARLRRKGRA